MGIGLSHRIRKNIEKYAELIRKKLVIRKKPNIYDYNSVKSAMAELGIKLVFDQELAMVAIHFKSIFINIKNSI